MTNKNLEVPIKTSTALAADTSLFHVWDPAVPFPSVKEMCSIDAATHISIERGQADSYNYLHDAAITWHNDRFYLAWANHPENGDNVRDELIRGCTSTDGLNWSEPTIWFQPPRSGADSLNYPLLFSHDGELHSFIVGWHDGDATAELFILNDEGYWRYHREACIPRFLPFCSPQCTIGENWVLGGEYKWNEAAIAISKKDDFMQWERVKIPRPDDLELHNPETAIVNQEDRLLAFCRPYKTQTAPVSESRDGGRTWTTLALSNFPLAPSQPFSGKLSTGQNYLLTNNLEEGGNLLTIAVTGTKGGLFRRIFKLRSGSDGNCIGKPAGWTYPNAVEHDGKLYITYSQGRKDCAVSIVPVGSLAV